MCRKKYLLSMLLLVLLANIAQSTNSELQAEATKNSSPFDSESQYVLRQSQNTFLDWIVSLITQRPIQALNGTTIISPLTPTVASTTSAPLITSTAMFVAFSTTTTTTTSKPSPSLATSKRPLIVSSTTTTTTTTPATTSTPATTPAPAPVTLNPPRECNDCVCGIANIQKRIVGGQETEVHQYPWVAMLLYGGRFYCAATLINDQFLISASHCVYGFRKERITVRLLEHDRKMSHFSKIDRKLANITTHPKYNFRTFDNDIAVLKLDEPVTMTEVLRPVCMPTPGKSFKGETAIVTGWGAVKVGGPTSDTLQEVQVPVMSQTECRKSRYGPTRITDNMLCAGFPEGEKDSCQGDSGGPLHIVANGTREHQLAGVVSWGEGCAKAGYPGVYARVNRYSTWIKTLTRNACLCHSETKRIRSED